MKLSLLIKQLQKLQRELGEENPDVIVDYEEDVGWHEAEEVSLVFDAGEHMVNIMITEKR